MTGREPDRDDERVPRTIMAAEDWPVVDDTGWLTANELCALERIGEQAAAELAVLREQRDAGLFAAIRLYTDELRQLRAMRDGLVRLRADIDGDLDCCSYTTEIDALLALAPKEPA